MNPYDYALSLMTLSDVDRAELKNKRGFNDETIDKFRFKSPILKKNADDFRDKLLEKYSEDDLKDAKLILSSSDLSPKMTNKEGDLTFALTGDKVVIPYFNENNECIYMRCHKFGLSGVTPKVYDATRENEDFLILTEGEAKACALWQLGYSGCASPGISLFGGKNFGQLEDWIQEQDVKSVYVMFDGEIKNDPIKYPKQYKNDKRVRHDTDFWAYKLARMLSQSGIETKVVVWPESWLIDGKIDCDSALAAGRVRKDFDALLDNAYTHKEFRKSWSGEKKQVLEQKCKKEAFKSDIIQKNGQYYKKVKKGDEEYEVAISNFTMEIVAKNSTRNEETDRIEIVRETIIKSQDGEHSARLNIEPSHFTSMTEFKKAVMGVGDFQYTGTGDDLVNLVNRLFAEQEVKDCQRPIQIGMIKEDDYKGFFTDNVAFCNSEVINADDDGGFWVNDIYVKPSSYIVEGSPGILLNTDEFDWREGVDKLCEAYGSEAPRVLVLWLAASLFSDTFFNIRGGRGSFPLMYVGGGFKSGKTTLIGIANNFLGMGDIQQLDIATTTKAGLDRTMKFYSSLPVWIDELRSETFDDNMQGMLRGAHNRSSGIKAMRTGTSQVRTTDVRCTMLLSGQETPPDAALNERMVKVNITSFDRPKSNKSFRWMTKNILQLSSMAYELLSKRDEIEKYIKDNYVDNCDDLNERLENARVAGNYGVILTMAEYLGMDKVDGFEDYMYDLASESCRESDERNESSAIFLEFLDIMHEENIHAGKYFHRRRDHDVDVAWSKMYSKYKDVKTRRRETVMDSKALLNQLRDNGTAKNSCNADVDGKSTRCWRMDNTKLPDILMDYIEKNYGRSDGF